MDLAPPGRPLQKSRFRFKVLTLRAQHCFGKPPFRPRAQGPQPAPRAGDRLRTKSHCSDTTRAPALPLALWPSEWSPRVPDGLRDKWTSPSCLYPAQAWMDATLFPKEPPVCPEARCQVARNTARDRQAPESPSTLLLLSSGRKPWGQPRPGHHPGEHSSDAVLHLGGGQPGQPTGAGSAAGLTLPTPPPAPLGCAQEA